MKDNKKKHKVLIVDDIPQNIQVLAHILTEAGYKIGFAQNGKTALDHTDSTQFDLILLDIMMPGMDGYQVCEQLKKDKKKKDIPIIFITAKDETSDKTAAFALGAVDYITKPFDTQEVLARVKAHLTIRDYTIRLEQMVEERTRQLLHADRLATIGTFSSAVAHEISNPLNYILVNTRLVQLFWQEAKSILDRHQDEDETGNIVRDINDIGDMIERILEGGQRITQLINTLRTYSRQSALQKQETPLIDIINESLRLINYKIRHNNITIELDVPKDIILLCDPQKISQVFINLINNSCDAIASQSPGPQTLRKGAEDTLRAPMVNLEGQITITAAQNDKNIEIKILDTGPGIPDDLAEKIFDPFFTTKGKEEGTGLGLFVVRTIIEEHNGSINLSPYAHGKGAEFNILLPKA